MPILNQFSELLDAIDKLPPEDVETLMEIVEHRRIAQRRLALARDIREARQEFQDSGCQPQSAKDLMKEILS